jgi:hypothetical protein
MNVIELQERLKDLPEQALMQEMQMPTGTAPQFLVLSELKRRKRMRDEYQRQQAQGMQTVAEEAVTAAGMPAQGIMQMSRAMAPQSAIAQNTGVNDMMQQQSVRAPQPEQPMMMAAGGYVRKMRDGGFGENVEYDYVAFLQEMGLNDTPDARDAFRRYQERMNAQYALEGPRTDPSLFTPGIDRPPQAMALSDVSTDVGAFLPGASARQPLFDIPRLDVPPMSRDVLPMTSMPPALMSGSADTIDFDASVAAVPAPPPPRDPESYLDTIRRITREAADTARGMGIPIPESQPGIDIDNIKSVGEFEYGGLDDVNQGEEDLSLEQMMRDIGFGPAMDKAAQIQQAAEARKAAAAEARAAEAARMMDINEIPATGRRVTDAGELIAPTSTPPVTDTQKVTPPVTDTQKVTGGPVAGGAGGGAGGGADYGPIESRIARMLEERERSAQADKWLSLAQTGLALMASDQPTIGGAIGEAGLAGIGALQQARSQYDKDIMELLNMQAGVQRARAAGARSARTGGLTASNLVSLINNLTNVKARIANDIATQKPDPATGEVPDVRLLQNQLIDVELRIRDYTNQLNRLGGSADVESGVDFDAAAS